MKYSREFLRFNQGIIFGEVGALIGVPLTPLIVSHFTVNAAILSSAAMIGGLILGSAFWLIVNLSHEQAQAARDSGAESRSENSEGSCGEGFWLWPRRRGPSIPAAGCKARANEGQRQKIRRPEGFLWPSLLASLLLGLSPIKGIFRPLSLSSSPARQTAHFQIFRQALKNMMQRIAYFTPAAFLISLLTYHPIIWLVSYALLRRGTPTLLAGLTAEALAFTLFLGAMNLYRLALYRVTAVRL